MAYQYLYRLGYRNMRVLQDGLPGWRERQYPLEGSAQHAALPGQQPLALGSLY